MPWERVLLGSFRARDESGNEYDIQKWQEQTVARARGAAVRQGKKPYFTLDSGEEVHGMGKGRYQVLPAGPLLTAIDPDAT